MAPDPSRRVSMDPRPRSRPSSAAPRLIQDFEGHGVVIPQPLDRGFLPMPKRAPSRPQSAPVEPPAAAEARGRRRRKGGAVFVINAHVRDKIISINVGEGNQVIYWLGLTAVQRYVRLPDSYSSPFSNELTPKAVYIETGEALHNSSRIKDELQSGMHAWIDVGDGIALSTVESRRVLDFGGAFELPVEEVSEKLSWCEVKVKTDEEERDARLSMKYTRLVFPEPPPFVEWSEELEASHEDQWAIFNNLWKVIEENVADLPDAALWAKDVKVILYKYFLVFVYVFVHKAAPNKSPFTTTMEREEFWRFIKRCKLTSPYMCLADIDVLLADIGPKKPTGGKSVHDPRDKIQLAEFLEAVLRISLTRQRDWQTGPETHLPECLTDIIEQKILIFERIGLDPGDFMKHSKFRMQAAQRDKRGEAEPEDWLLDPGVRKMLQINRPDLRTLFRRWAQSDEYRETMTLKEMLALLKPSGLLGPDLTEAQVLEAVGLTVLGADHAKITEWVQVISENPSQLRLLFHEFTETLARTAFFKYKDDHSSPQELKAHELCQLLIWGPISKMEPPPRYQAEVPEAQPPTLELEKRRKKK